MPALFFHAEHQGGRLADAALEVAGAGREWADRARAELVAVLLGPDTRRLVATLGEHGADRVLLCEDERLAGYAPESCTQLLAESFRQHGPAAMLFAGTSTGHDLAVRLAARLGCGVAAGCTGLACDPGGQLRITRLAYADRIQVTAVGARVVTLQRRVPTEGGCGEVRRAPRQSAEEAIELALPPDAARLEVLETVKADPRTVPLPQAEFIVSGGNGVRDFALLWQLADRMGASVGGSRVVCDDGRLPRERQIGESGTTVKPRCYLALGISGASQHLRGMQDSQLIIAVNTDRHAPLVKRANMAIVGDAEAVMRAMLERLDSR